MPSNKFVPETREQAQQLAKNHQQRSKKTDNPATLAESREVVAGMFGCKTWNVLCKLIDDNLGAIHVSHRFTEEDVLKYLPQLTPKQAKDVLGAMLTTATVKDMTERAANAFRDAAYKEAVLSAALVERSPDEIEDSEKTTYELMHRNKWIMSGAENITDFINTFEEYAAYFRKLREQGLVLINDGSVEDDYATFITDNEEIYQENANQMNEYIY